MAMNRVLMTWLGGSDLSGSKLKPDAKNYGGPIFLALSKHDDFRKVIILAGRSPKDDDDIGDSDISGDKITEYLEWLQEEPRVRNLERRGLKIEIEIVELSNPMDYQRIYSVTREHIDSELKQYAEKNLVFYISPGTPAMSAAWVILAKTKCPEAKLIHSAEKDKEGNYLVQPAEINLEVLRERFSRDVVTGDLGFRGIVAASQAMKEVIDEAAGPAKLPKMP